MTGAHTLTEWRGSFRQRMGWLRKSATPWSLRKTPTSPLQQMRRNNLKNGWRIVVKKWDARKRFCSRSWSPTKENTSKNSEGALTCRCQSIIYGFSALRHKGKPVHSASLARNDIEINSIFSSRNTAMVSRARTIQWIESSTHRLMTRIPLPFLAITVNAGAAAAQRRTPRTGEVGATRQTSFAWALFMTGCKRKSSGSGKWRIKMPRRVDVTWIVCEEWSDKRNLKSHS